MYALDTNSFVYFFKGMGGVGSRLLAVTPAEVRMPAVVLYELEVGIAMSSRPQRRRAQLDDLLAAVAVLPFAAAEAAAAARIRGELTPRGESIGPIDVLIAATALASGATLVTHNVREFGRIRGLRVEDWF